MEFVFQPVKVYREKYTVLAKFYPNDDKNKEDARLFADIVDKAALDAPIDAYLIMINPGSCRKKQKDFTSLANSKYAEMNVVEAMSDPAQKCVMAFMDKCELKKVRMLNLLDYREGNKEYYDYEYIKPPTQAAQIKRIMQLVECFQQYQASMQ